MERRKKKKPIQRWLLARRFHSHLTVYFIIYPNALVLTTELFSRHLVAIDLNNWVRTQAIVNEFIVI